VTHEIKQEPGSGQISIEDCTWLRRLQWRGTLSVLPPTSSPMNPLEGAPETPRRRNISLPLPYYVEHEPTGETGGAFRLHPARFTPVDNIPSSDSTETSLSLTMPTRLRSKSVAKTTPALHKPPPITTSKSHKAWAAVGKTRTMGTPDIVKSVPLFYGDYGENENPSVWFAQFELSLPISWTDAQRIQWFGMQLTPGEIAEEWYHNLTSHHLSSFSNLKLEFFKCWPPPKRPKLTQAQQKECIMAQVLKEDEVGVWTQEGRMGNYTHVTWAVNTLRLALGMGDVDGAMIEYALEGILDLLKDHLKCIYNSWDEFVEDIQDVPNIKLKRGHENLDKE